MKRIDATSEYGQSFAVEAVDDTTVKIKVFFDNHVGCQYVLVAYHDLPMLIDTLEEAYRQMLDTTPQEAS